MQKINETGDFKTFQAFRPHFDALARVAYFKVVMKPISYCKLLAHSAYRTVVWVLIIFYNIQLVIRVIQARSYVDRVVDTLFVLLTTLNTLGKQIAFNARSCRIDRLVSVINGPYFAPTNSYHVNIMKENATAMSRLLYLYHFSIFSCGSLFCIYPLVNKFLGQNVDFVGYIPFDTNHSPAFEIAVVYMSVLLTFQAYGHVTMDCTVVSFYAQGKTQLQMLRYNLKHLDYSSDGVLKIEGNRNSIIDKVGRDFGVHGRLVFCVEHYKQIVWFVKEVESLFGEAMIVQFFVMSWVICMTVYKMVALSLISAEFLCVTLYLGCMLAQFFLYCYYGTQVKAESEYINQSIYCGDWISAHPSLRRQLLVMMVRCSRSLTPMTAFVIPMSLETYVSVLKFSYTLFTFLNRN